MALFLLPHSIRRLVVLSLVATFVLSVLPLNARYFFWWPDWLLMMLCFWAMHRPSSLPLGAVFAIGLLTDLTLNSPLGLHALAFVSAYSLVSVRRFRLRTFHFGIQALSLAGALTAARILMAVVWMYENRVWVGAAFFVPPFVSALLWPLLNKIMFAVPAFKHQLQ